MGPAAGLLLHRLIIENTLAKTDQEHLRVVHVSYSDMVPDRTESLFDGNPDAPAQGMAAAVLSAYEACGKLDMPAVAGVPCNTFHAEPIWKSFTNSVTHKFEQSGKAESIGSLKILNMVEETVEHIKKRLPRGAKVGILSTTGTRNERIYSAPLEAAGIEVVEPEDQAAVHNIIYDPDWGIKAVPAVSGRAASETTAEIKALAERGADLIVLGCTEFPLAVQDRVLYGAVLLDPMEVLARALVKSAEPDKLK